MAGLEEARGLRSGLYVPDADGEVFVTRGHPRTVRERAQAVDQTGARLESQHASANLDVPRSGLGLYGYGEGQGQGSGVGSGEENCSRSSECEGDE